MKTNLLPFTITITTKVSETKQRFAVMAPNRSTAVRLAINKHGGNVKLETHRYKVETIEVKK